MVASASSVNMATGSGERDDSALWDRLLALVRAEGGDGPDSLYGTLLGFHIYGARLEPDPAGGIRLTRGPVPRDLKGTGMTEEEWAETWALWREKWLLPKRDELIRALERVEVGGG